MTDPSKLLGVIIEAPGKIRTFRKLLASLGYNNTLIVATMGRLYDLPSEPVDIKSQAQTDLRTRALNPQIIERIKTLGRTCHRIILATDADCEGELIAHDAKALLGKNKDKCARILLTRLTPKALELALRNPSAINQSAVNSAIARRYFDRITGYSRGPLPATGHTRAIPTGRILTPTLAHFEASVAARVAGDISISVDDGWVWRIKFDAKDREAARHIAVRLEREPPPTIDCVSTHSTPDTSAPLTGPELLLQCSQSLGISVVSSAQVLQQLYESGRISYWRSDCTRMSAESASAIAKMANHFGVDGFDPGQLVQRGARAAADRAQGAHEAVLPLTHEFRLFEPPGNMAPDEAVLVLLTRHLLKCGQKGRHIVRSVGAVDFSRSSALWRDAQLRLGASAEVFKASIRRTGSPVYARENFPDVAFAPCRALRIGESCLLNGHMNDAIVLRELIALNLGRPSTIGSHASTIATRYLRQDLSLNSNAQHSLALAWREHPNLRSPAVAASIEDLLQRNDLEIPARLSGAIKLSGGVNSDQGASGPRSNETGPGLDH